VSWIQQFLGFNVFEPDSRDAFTAAEELYVRAGKVGLYATREKLKRNIVEGVQQQAWKERVISGNGAQTDERNVFRTSARIFLISVILLTPWNRSLCETSSAGQKIACLPCIEPEGSLPSRILGSHGGEYEEAVFWVVAPCNQVEVYQRFRGPCCLHRTDDGCSKDFWNVGKLLPDYTALQPRRLPSTGFCFHKSPPLTLSWAIWIQPTTSVLSTRPQMTACTLLSFPRSTPKPLFFLGGGGGCYGIIKGFWKCLAVFQICWWKWVQ
jgi:hypothetical protein